MLLFFVGLILGFGLSYLVYLKRGAELKTAKALLKEYSALVTKYQLLISNLRGDVVKAKNKLVAVEGETVEALRSKVDEVLKAL